MESPEHLARVVNAANVVSRVCLDPLALPARKARRVNRVKMGVMAP